MVDVSFRGTEHQIQDLSILNSLHRNGTWTAEHSLPGCWQGPFQPYILAAGDSGGITRNSLCGAKMRDGSVAWFPALVSQDSCNEISSMVDRCFSAAGGFSGAGPDTVCMLSGTARAACSLASDCWIHSYS